MAKETASPFRLVVGRSYTMTGDVTTLAAIVDRTPTQLETRLGFGQGRLKAGFSVLYLVQKMAVDDFIWGDQTRYSGRWQFRRDVGEYVQRIDLLRFELAKESGFDEAQADAAFYGFLGREQNKLNLRDGADRIVKIFPNIPHDASLGWQQQYPNAPTGDTPQWTIARPKAMLCVANVLPGDVYRPSL